MPGSKRNKLKKVLSPQSPPPPPADPAADADLMDDLFAQLDSKDAVVQQETAQVIQQVQLNQSTGTQDSVPPPSQKPKDRHRARLVC